jgi:hypothetical protein
VGRSRESKGVSNRINTEYNRIGRDYDAYNQRIGGNLDEARERSRGLFDEAMSGYRRFSQEGFGINPQARGVYSEFARTGGMSPENLARMRGKGVFDEFARTGGLSETDVANLRSRGSATIPSFFQGVRDELTRGRALQGGYAPGYDAQMAATVRDQSQAGQRAALETETGITDIRNRGRMWGAGSLSAAEQAIVDALQRGRLSGAAGLQGQDEFSAGMNLQGARGMTDLYGMTPGEVALYENLALRGMQGRGDETSRLLGLDASYHPNVTWWERFGMPIVNAGVGGAAAYLTGQPPRGGATSRQMGFGNLRSDYGDY